MSVPLFACLYFPQSAPRSDALAAVVREFSARIEARSDRLVLCDVSGLERLFGNAQAIGVNLGRAAVKRGLAPRVAVAGTRVAARLVACARPGLTVVPRGAEAAAVAALPIKALGALVLPSVLATLSRWGVRTLGEVAALPAAALSARLGAAGPMLCRLARGEDWRPFVPDPTPARFEASLDLEWPVEALEPLSFVLARLLEPLCADLARADRGAVGVSLSLRLVTRETWTRALDLPAPIRDPRVLRTLLLLDLESHPPPAGVDRVTVEAASSPGRIVQFSLIERPRPSPEQFSTLMARLNALMGEGRSGVPVLVDSHAPGAFEIRALQPEWLDAQRPAPSAKPVTGAQRVPGVLRRFRVPVVATVMVDKGHPVRVTTGRRSLPGGQVEQFAGPWRTSGEWWRSSAWDRDEWDVWLAGGAIYRLSRDRAKGRWLVEGMVD